jgi:hypothetical protein
VVSDRLEKGLKDNVEEKVMEAELLAARDKTQVL